MTEPEPTLVQKLAAEGLGTFVLVFFGCGTALTQDLVATALAFGLTVVAMAYAVGHISGGHFNPAISVGAAISGRLSWINAGLYSAVQLAGAIIAAVVLGVLGSLLDKDFTETLAAVSNKWAEGPDLAWLAALLIETIGTFVFVFVILAVTDRRRENGGIPAPLVIGLTLTLCHLGMIGFTGTSVNPARSLGPALFGGWDDALKYQWVFLIAPLLGAAIAGVLYPLIFGRDGAPVPGSGLAAPQSAAAPQPVAQSYPGWAWDAATQQWVPDPTTAQGPPTQG